MNDREKVGLRGPVRSCMNEYGQGDLYTHSIETIYGAAGIFLLLALSTPSRKIGSARGRTTQLAV